MAATRFPDKPLASILGLPMIEHVRRRVAMASLVDEVIVATCDQAIVDVVEAAGGKAVMTANTHERCTDRIAEAALGLHTDVIINVQGDEPLVQPSMMDAVVRPLLDEPDLVCVNLAVPIANDAEFNDVNAVKTVTDLNSDMLCCSRSPIPSPAKAESPDYLRLKQLGIIAFRSDFLQTFSKLSPTPLEIVESIDMMRAVEHGYKIRVIQVPERMIGVDLPGDIARVEALLANDPLFSQYR